MKKLCEKASPFFYDFILHSNAYQQGQVKGNKNNNDKQPLWKEGSVLQYVFINDNTTAKTKIYDCALSFGLANDHMDFYVVYIHAHSLVYVWVYTHILAYFLF